MKIEDLDEGDNFLLWATGKIPNEDKYKCTLYKPCGECKHCKAIALHDDA